MTINDIIRVLEQKAPPALQEAYDNAGLITGNPGWECTGALCTLDATEAVIMEAIEKGCNLVVAHHPIVFSGLKKITGKHYVERAVIAAIKNDIAIYAAHTNLDNVMDGVNQRIADKLQLQHYRILAPKPGQLLKLYTFVPAAQAEEVRSALFTAGAGHIGEYSEVSFNAPGVGSFKGSENTHPFVGEPGKRHEEPEIKIEVIVPSWLQRQVVEALLNAHPYEEVAYDLVALSNDNQQIGSGLIGELAAETKEEAFFDLLKAEFGLKIIRHTPFLGKNVKKIAVCGGSGAFLTKKAMLAGADVYVTADVKYHEFFEADGRMVIADIGHWESEQFTTDLLMELLQSKFLNFAVLKSGVTTNPVRYFL